MVWITRWSVVRRVSHLYGIVRRRDKSRLRVVPIDPKDRFVDSRVDQRIRRVVVPADHKRLVIGDLSATEKKRVHPLVPSAHRQLVGERRAQIEMLGVLLIPAPRRLGVSFADLGIRGAVRQHGVHVDERAVPLLIPSVTRILHELSRELDHEITAELLLEGRIQEVVPNVACAVARLDT